MRHLPIPNKRLIFFIIFDLVLLALAVMWLVGGTFSLSDDMRMTSSAFAHDENIPAEYTCDGPGSPPPLAWSDAPEGTKSFALIVEDPDAPAGMWTHWTVWNIPDDVSGIVAGAVPPSAVQGVTSARTPGWHAPCPPFGEHRYFFKLYALDAILGLPPTTDAAALEKAMDGHVLDKTGLIGRYGRSGS